MAALHRRRRAAALRLAEIGSQVRSGKVGVAGRPTSSAPGSVPESVPHPPPTQPHGQNPPTPQPISPETIATTVGYTAPAVQTGVRHPHRQNAPSVASITPVAPPLTALTSAAADAIAYPTQLEPRTQQALLRSNVADLWEQLGGHGRPPAQISVTPLNIAEKVPDSNGVVLRQRRGKRPELIVSQQAAFNLASPASQARKATREALSGSLTAVQGQAKQRRRSAVRALLAGRTTLPGLTADQSRLATQILRVGERAGATHKQEVAAIETGLVESNLANLDYGDADSQGWRQERTSLYPTGAQGPTNVKAAAQRFFEEAYSDTGGSGGAGMTAGQLAQAIQASAYPDRYDEVQGQARPVVNAFLDAIGGQGSGGTQTQQPQAPPRDRFLRFVTLSDGLPSAADLGVKNGDLAIANIHPDLQRALMTLSQQTGVKPILNEGWRTESYQAFLAQTVSGPVAAPGTSKHESGLAVDIDNYGTYTEAQLNAAGLGHMVADDPEHLQLLDEPAALVGPLAGQPAEGSSSGGYTPAATGITTGGVAAPGAQGSSALERIRRRRNRGQRLGTPPSISPLQAPAFSSALAMPNMASAAQSAIAGDDARSAEVQAIMQRAGLL